MEKPLVLLAVLLLCFVAFVAPVVVMHRRRQQHGGQWALQGSTSIHSLRQLLALVQQHRGLTAAFINGNSLCTPDINQLNAQVKQQLRAVVAQNPALLHSATWGNVVDHWQRLANAYRRTSGDNNFHQHNMLIASLLYLMEELGEQHGLIKTGSNQDTDWRYLLSIAEYISQVRKLGVDAAVTGSCSQVVRLQLAHLHNKIAASVDDAWSGHLYREIKTLLRCLEVDLVQEPLIITPGEFFAIATACIEHLLEAFDCQVEQLQFRVNPHL